MTESLHPRYTPGGNVYFEESGQYDQSEYWSVMAQTRDLVDQQVKQEVKEYTDEKVEESSPYRGTLTAESPIDEYRTESHDGWYRVTGSAVATGLGLPEMKRGIFTVKWILGSSTMGNVVQTFVTSDGTTWTRTISYGGSAWSEWSMGSFAQDSLGPTDLNIHKTPLTRTLPAPYPDGYQNNPPGNTTASVFTVWGTPGSQWAAQEVFQYGPNPRRWWRISKSYTEWNDWVEVKPIPDTPPSDGTNYFTAPPPAAGAHDMRVQYFKDEYPLVSTGGKGAVVFRYDHGLTNFKDVLLPLHQQYNIKAYIAMNSRNWDEAENNGATQAEARQWRTSGLVEWGNHTADHRDRNTAEGIYDNIVNGRRELESQVGGTIHGFTVPGLSEYNKFEGFGAGYFNAFSETYAGGLILANHAISSGYVTQQAGEFYRTIDGTIRQGGRHIGWDQRDFAEIKTYIDYAVENKVALTLMCHPRVMGSSPESSFWTPDVAEQIISYVRQLIDEGHLADISYYQSHHAQLEPLPTSTYQSGLRDISGELINGWTGTLFVERDGKNVYFRGRLDASDATGDIAWMLPEGYRPGFIQSSNGPIDYGAGISWSHDTPPRMYRLNHYLDRFQLVGANGETLPISVNHNIRTLDPAPSSDPGVPA